MAAYSLRTWRRNGVACDELIFLPGTPHAEYTESAALAPGSNTNVPTASLASRLWPPARSEGDVAAGGWAAGNHAANTTQHIPQVAVEMVALETPENFRLIAPSMSPRNRARSLSRDSSLSSINEFINSWDDDSSHRDEEDKYQDVEVSDGQEDLMAPLNVIGRSIETASVMSARTNERVQSQQQQQQNNSAVDQTLNVVRSTSAITNQPHNQAERFRENHPQISRFGSFFFFRPSTSTTQNATYAPSGPSVVGAALDLSMPVLFNFHLFIEAYNHLDPNGSDTPAKILPLIFLSVLIVRTVFPPSRRGRFWSTIKFTATAPFHRSHFRDVYLGDVLTSLVRPLQDVTFALAYYVTVIWGTVTAKYNLSESGRMLEASWILHNVVLPSVALLILWWKFLQTLRESYDTGKRWPNLGNAFKYLSATVVILYGMTHPENRRSFWWIVAFCLTLAYQIFWDTVMDWDLFIIVPKENEGLDISDAPSWFSISKRQISSVRPDSRWLLAIERCLRPIRLCLRWMCARIPSFTQIQLRPRRLYKTEAFYWKIFAYNTVFRFCWMLSFIPAYHLSASGRDVITTFSSDTNSYVGVLLPIAEILRRTLWGFLSLEMQTIRMLDGNLAYHYAQVDLQSLDEMEVSSLSVDSSKPTSRHFLPTWLGAQQQLQHDAALASSPWKISNCFQISEETRNKLFLAELTLWAAAFVGLGLLATT